MSIAAIYDGNTPVHPWGWKTRPHHYSDDAVRIMDINDGTWPPTIGKSWASGERIGTLWDTAFVLTTNRMFVQRDGHFGEHDEKPVFPPKPGPGPNPVPIPWPSEARLDFNSDLIIDFQDFAVLAGYWLAEGEVWPEWDAP